MEPPPTPLPRSRGLPPLTPRPGEFFGPTTKPRPLRKPPLPVQIEQHARKRVRAARTELDTAARRAEHELRRNLPETMRAVRVARRRLAQHRDALREAREREHGPFSSSEDDDDDYNGGRL